MNQLTRVEANMVSVGTAQLIRAGMADNTLKAYEHGTAATWKLG